MRLTVERVAEDFGFGLASAGFTGTIPTEIGRVSFISRLDLSGNKLTSTLPT